MTSKNYVKDFLKVIYLHSMHPPFWGLAGSQSLEGGCWKGGLLFQQGEQGRWGGGLQFLHKKTKI